MQIHANSSSGGVCTTMTKNLLHRFFPKRFTVGVLNATLDLAALVLVAVAAFLGSDVVLSPVVSGCLPSCEGWVLVGVAASGTKTFRNQNHRFQSKFACCKLFGVYAGVIFPEQFTVGVLNATLDVAGLVLVGVVGFLGSEVVLSPVVSHCLRLSPFMWGMGVGWCGRLLGL